MRWQRRPARPVARTALKAIVAGTLMFAGVASCTMPQPHFPSIGAASAHGTAADGAGAAGPTRTDVRAQSARRKPTTTAGGHRPVGIHT